MAVLIGFGLANNSLHVILPVMALVLLLRVCGPVGRAAPALSVRERGAGWHSALRGELRPARAPVGAVISGGGESGDAGGVWRFAVDVNACR